MSHDETDLIVTRGNQRHGKGRVAALSLQVQGSTETQA
jgi:hypothetical protein